MSSTETSSVRTGTMPAPHQRIAIEVLRWWRGIFVTYTARPSELTAAGLVSRYMEQKILNQRAGCLLDEKGRRFELRHERRFKSKRELWEGGYRVHLKYRVDHHNALELLGVRAIGLPDDDESRELETASATVGLNQRARAVGRYQRFVRWSVVENVLWPDWREVRSSLSALKESQP